ncbi:MAG: cytochrome P450 [Chloroflexi bacterium]|nr:MAG: cytochrome P450 [Chloroflexota bacterium]
MERSVKIVKNEMSIAVKAAKAGGKVLLAYFKDQNYLRRAREDPSLQTIVDLASEEAIRGIIQAAFPDHTIESEESGMLCVRGSEYQWLIDALDGAENFFLGIPYFSISVALCEDHDKPQIALIYQPVTEELYGYSRYLVEFGGETPQRMKSQGGSESGSAMESRVAWYHCMQEKQPVRYRAEYNLWEVFGYQEVQQILLDHGTFSSEKKPSGGLPLGLGMSDPPRHCQLGRLVSQALTPGRLGELRPRLVRFIDEILEAAIGKKRMNILSELAYPLPVRVMGELLGVPPTDRQRFEGWSYQLYRQMLGVSELKKDEIVGYMSELVNERKSKLGEDLVSALLVAEDDGVRLTDEEIISVCLELMMAGNMSVTILLSSVLARLCRQPKLYQALRQDPSLIGGAIEETLRYDMSTINVWRTARHDTVLQGQEIKAGQYIVCWTEAANFDERYFADALRFDMRRSPNPHVSFGHGIHACLGAALARLEARVALERMVAHCPAMGLDLEKPVQLMEDLARFSLIQALEIAVNDQLGHG